jgi:hypothetical protein
MMSMFSDSIRSALTLSGVPEHVKERGAESSKVVADKPEGHGNMLRNGTR